MEFPFLFSPIKINQMELKNRIVMAGMHLHHNDDGYINDRMVQFFTRRAEGGAGLIIIGTCSVDSETSPPGIIIDSYQAIPGLKRLADSIKNGGAKVACQISHMGATARAAWLGGRQPVGASAVPSRMTGETPKALELEEIIAIQDKFVQAALRVKEAGYDAVEILGAYLIVQFLSPLTNVREDEYGGSLSGRMRFGVETAQKVRAALGPDYPVLWRLAGSDFMPGGNDSCDMQTFAVELEKAGVDLFNVTGGPHETRIPQITMAVPRRAFSYLAQGIKSVVSVPVLASNRINDPADGEAILRNGEADLITMARGLMTDPDLPVKAKEGRADQIYHCIGCNQGCMDKLFQQQQLTCMVNPRVGMEEEWQSVPTAKPKNILVIGGGPAGMKAACIAAERGHSVTLVDKADRLGGQLLLNKFIPGRSEMVTAAKDLINNIKAMDVKIRLNQKADMDFIRKSSPEAVILASGAVPIELNLPGIESENVHQAWDVLAGKVHVGKKVVIVGGNAVGLETAMYLASQGTLSPEAFHFLTIHQAETPEKLSSMLTKGNKEVTVVEMTQKIGGGTGASTRWIIMAELKRLGVTLLKGSKAVSITPEGLKVETEQDSSLLAADTVVIAAGSRSENKLADEIKKAVPELYVIGDAKKPRTALEAIQEGFLTGLKV